MSIILLAVAIIISYFTWKFSSNFFIQKGTKKANSHIAAICFALIVFLIIINFLAPYIRVN